MTKRILIKSIPEFKAGDKAVNKQTVRDKAIDAVYWLPGCTTQLDLDRTGGMWIEREVGVDTCKLIDLPEGKIGEWGDDQWRWGTSLEDGLSTTLFCKTASDEEWRVAAAIRDDLQRDVDIIEREVEPAVVEYDDVIDGQPWGSTLTDEETLNDRINKAFEKDQKVRVTIKAVE